ncbi:MAG TPA: nitroreductase family deazaflavin-dependent oxidoreductase [Anaerolineales bacterium]|nr:nitroreductase family deazaflavin-dependent oxidoreductase [Anaerolineales bacterium]
MAVACPYLALSCRTWPDPGRTLSALALYQAQETRETVIEVVRHDEANNIYYVASGWGTRSDWFQSIRADPEVKIQVGNRQVGARAQVLVLEEAADELSMYAKNHPAAFHEISMLLTGKALDGTEDECKLLARSVPVIAFHPAIH